MAKELAGKQVLVFSRRSISALGSAAVLCARCSAAGQDHGLPRGTKSVGCVRLRNHSRWASQNYSSSDSSVTVTRLLILAKDV